MGELQGPRVPSQSEPQCGLQPSPELVSVSPRVSVGAEDAFPGRILIPAALCWSAVTWRLLWATGGLQAVHLVFVTLSAGSVPPALEEGWR